jgi:hypothetical protein
VAEKLTKVSNKYKIIIHKCLNNGINEYIIDYVFYAAFLFITWAITPEYQPFRVEAISRAANTSSRRVFEFIVSR